MNHIQFEPVENNRFEIEMTTLRTINSILHSCDGGYYNPKSKCWNLPNEIMDDIIQKFNNLAIIDSPQHAKIESQRSAVAKEIIVRLVNDSNKISIELSTYNKQVVEVIKTIKGAKFNYDLKIWYIEPVYLHLLILELEKIDFVKIENAGYYC